MTGLGRPARPLAEQRRAPRSGPRTRLHLRRARRQLHRRPRLGRAASAGPTALPRRCARQPRARLPQPRGRRRQQRRGARADPRRPRARARPGHRDLRRQRRPAHLRGPTSRATNGASPRSSGGCATPLPEAAILTATAPESWHFMELRPRTKARLVKALSDLNAVTRTVAARHRVPCLNVAEPPRPHRPRQLLRRRAAPLDPRPRTSDRRRSPSRCAPTSASRANFEEHEHDSDNRQADPAWVEADASRATSTGLEVGARFRSPGAHDHRDRPGLLRRPHRRSPPTPHRRRVGRRERVQRPHRPRHAAALLQRRPGPARPRARPRPARLRARRLQAAGAGSATRSTSRASWSRRRSSTRLTGLARLRLEDRQPARRGGRPGEGAGRLAPPAAAGARGRRARAGLSVILAGKRILRHRRRRPPQHRLRDRRAGPAEEGAEVLLTSFGRRRADDRAGRPPACPARPRCSSSTSTTRTICRALRESSRKPLGPASTAPSTRSPSPPPDALGGDFLATPRESAERRLRDQRLLLQGAGRGAGAADGSEGRAAASSASTSTPPSPGPPTTGWASPRRRWSRSAATSPGTSAPAASASTWSPPGPVRTAAASGVPGFDDLAEIWAEQAPLGWDADDPDARSPTPRCFLLSDLLAGDHRRDPPRRRRPARDRRGGPATSRRASPCRPRCRPRGRGLARRRRTSRPRPARRPPPSRRSVPRTAARRGSGARGG